MNEQATPHPFAAYLESLAGDRAALAALRRGLGQPPGTVAEMYPYVVPRLPAGIGRDEEDAHYLVAALFGYHPAVIQEGNLGDHLVRAVGSPDDLPAVERRFVALLNTHADDLAGQLRQMVSFLKSKEIPVHWSQLLRDVRGWSHPEHHVQRRWANAFWRAAAEPADDEADQKEKDQE